MATRILKRSDVAALVDMRAAIEAVEDVLGADARGECQMPAKVYLSMPDVDGDFRAMPARRGPFASLKWVNAHPQNPARYQLPSVLATLILNDAQTAAPLALMDATLITALRTGAVAAVATRHCFPGEPASLGIFGAGVQGELMVQAHRALYPQIEVCVHDLDATRAGNFASKMKASAVSADEAAACEVVCTTTPSRKPILQAKQLRCGHLNAMGADAPGKQELSSDALVARWVLVDELEQARHSGEINVPLAEGSYTLSALAGTLGQLIAGQVPRPAVGTPTLFDSTGLALQDLALAALVYEAAEQQDRGVCVDLDS